VELCSFGPGLRRAGRWSQGPGKAAAESLAKECAVVIDAVILQPSFQMGTLKSHRSWSRDEINDDADDINTRELRDYAEILHPDLEQATLHLHVPSFFVCCQFHTHTCWHQTLPGCRHVEKPPEEFSHRCAVRGSRRCGRRTVVQQVRTPSETLDCCRKALRSHQSDWAWWSQSVPQPIRICRWLHLCISPVLPHCNRPLRPAACARLRVTRRNTPLGNTDTQGHHV
jgi:hypothetical protein